MSLIRVPENKINNLSVIASRLSLLRRDEDMCHMDVDMWYAPSECHGDINEGFDRKYAELEKEVGFSIEEILDEIQERTSGKWCYYKF